MQRPEEGEYAGHFGKYVALVPGSDVLSALRGQIGGTVATLRGVSDEQSLRRYAEGKWSLREVVGHMIDTERIFAYRALRIGRGDETPLPGFDQDPYIVAAGFDRRDWGGLIDEFEVVRRGSTMLLGGFDGEAWGRRGTASGNPVTARAVAYVIAGHELHHMKIVRERYLG
jgi:DinB superfamily